MTGDAIHQQHQLPSDLIGKRLKEMRQRRGWSATKLAERCAAAGVPQITASVIANIETGRRDKDGHRRREVTVEELLALAHVLSVSPTNLLLPSDDEAPVEITPRNEHLAIWVRGWITGRGPLPPKNDADYAAAEAAYFREAPDREQRAHRVGMHPLMVQIDGSLKLFAREAILFTQGVPLQDPGSSPQLTAEALREAARRVSAYAGLLADELERVPTTEPTKKGR